MLSIDLNCDMGEGMDTDEVIMPYISSANIACGYHAGNLITMQQTIQLALKNKVAIGAHPGFNDQANFGRSEMHLPIGELYQLVYDQVQLLLLLCRQAGATLHHVKPHGALYNMAAKNNAMALTIARAVYDVKPQLIIYGLSGSQLITAAQSIGLKTASEVFADRTYQNDGSLTPRTQPNALIIDEEQAIQQALQMVTQQTVTSTQGNVIAVTAHTLCLHGDGAHAVAFTKSIYQQLQQHNINVTTI